MTTKCWRLHLRKDHIAVTLYTRTTDVMAERDLSAPPEDSLICIARQYRQCGHSDAQNLRDLAIGALMRFASAPQYDREYTQLEEVALVPDREADSHVGGTQGDRYVPIWEEPTQLDWR